MRVLVGCPIHGFCMLLPSVGIVQNQKGSSRSLENTLKSSSSSSPQISNPSINPFENALLYCTSADCVSSTNTACHPVDTIISLRRPLDSSAVVAVDFPKHCVSPSRHNYIAQKTLGLIGSGCSRLPNKKVGVGEPRRVSRN